METSLRTSASYVRGIVPRKAKTRAPSAADAPISSWVRRAPPLLPGNKVLIWYDPADPAEILVYGREGRASDLAFVVVGAILALAGTVIAILAP